MRIAVIGVGYVGLVTGACFAETGNHVVCMDVDGQKIERLKRGEIPIYEPHLEEIVKTSLKDGRLEFTDNFNEAVDHGLIIVIAVNTPQDQDGSADLRFVLQVASDIGNAIEKYRIIVVKSTVPVGTCERVQGLIRTAIEQRGLDIPFDIASNPEFLKEGTAVDDCRRPERVVIGVENSQVEEILEDLYAPFLRTGAPLLVMDLSSSEMTKYAANAMLATRISFMNQMANVCERVGADVMKVMRGIGTDSRIGPKFLFPGVGFGGSCFPKDVRALIRAARDGDYAFSILEQVLEANEQQRTLFLEKIKGFYQHNLHNKICAVWGLSFKPNTDDLRDAPAIDIIKGLTQCGARCCAYDPKSLDHAMRIFPTGNGVSFGDQYEVLDGADCLILLTEWLSFREPDFEQMISLMRAPVIFDGRNQYNPKTMEDLGFQYVCIGRPAVSVPDRSSVERVRVAPRSLVRKRDLSNPPP